MCEADTRVAAIRIFHGSHTTPRTDVRYGVELFLLQCFYYNDHT